MSGFRKIRCRPRRRGASQVGRVQPIPRRYPAFSGPAAGPELTPIQRAGGFPSLGWNPPKPLKQITISRFFGKTMPEYAGKVRGRNPRGPKGAVLREDIPQSNGTEYSGQVIRVRVAGAYCASGPLGEPSHSAEGGNSPGGRVARLNAAFGAKTSICITHESCSMVILGSGWAGACPGVAVTVAGQEKTSRNWTA